VLLIDGDLRNPSMHRMVGATNRIGFSSVLTGTSLAEAVQPTDQTHLSLLSSGPRPSSPADLLSSPALHNFLDRVSQSVDLIVIDGPPVMGLADATILGNAVEAVLFISGAGVVRRGAALRAIDRLKSSGADIVGGVLSRFDSKKANLGGYGYEYAYSYDYGAVDEDAAPAQSGKRARRA